MISKKQLIFKIDFKVYFDNSNSNIGMDLNVTGLKANLWPPYKSSQLNLPQQLAQSVELFEDFYSERRKTS
jgi:cullin 1